MKLFSLARFLAALAVAAPAYAAPDWPDWAMDPKVEEGSIAAAECTEASDNLSLDRQLIVAQARTALAGQIETRVKAVDKVYTSRMQKTGQATVTSTVFTRASEQIVEQALKGSKVARFEVIKKMFGSNLVCAVVVLDPSGTRTYFNQLVQVARVDAPPAVQEELFDTFRGRKL